MAFAAMALKKEKPWGIRFRSTHGCFGWCYFTKSSSATGRPTHNSNKTRSQNYYCLR